MENHVDQPQVITTLASTRRHSQKDQGWSWVIASCGLVNVLLSFGIYRSLGVFFVELNNVFESSMAQSSLLFTSFGISFTVSALFLNTAFGGILHERALVAIGACVGSLGFLIVPFATRIEEVTFSVGLGMGIFVQTSLASSFSLVSRYFEKRLALASCLVALGPSVGIFLWPVFIQYCLDEYSYKGTCLIIGGILLNGLVSSGLMRPYSDGKEAYGNPRYELIVFKYETTSDESKKNITYTPEVQSRLLSGQLIDNSFGGEVRSACISPSSLPSVVTTPVHSIPDGKVDESHKRSTLLRFWLSLKGFVLIEQVDRRNFSLRNLFDLTLCRSPVFYLLLTYFFCLSGGIELFIQFYPAITQELALNRYQSAVLLSIIGVTGIIGRILFGIIGDLTTGRLKILVITQSLVALSVFLCQFLRAFWAQIIFALVYGFTFGSPYVYRLAVIKEVLGEVQISKVLGIENFISGLSIIGGSPLIGYLRDITGGYNVPLYLSALMLATTSVLLLMMICFRRRASNDHGGFRRTL